MKRIFLFLATNLAVMLVLGIASSVLGINRYLDTQGLNLGFYFGGTSLLIIVGVAMDTVQQVESQLIMRHYDGFMKKTRIRGRRD